jgi:AraC family transcriptional regulator, regulatory protein of adaptative response / methylated-DNA-[protein]-cysteine methyltransferase
MRAVIKQGGDVTTVRYAVGECSLGLVLAALSDKGVCAILLGDDAGQLARELRERFPDSALVDGGADFGVVLDKVVGLIEAPDGELELLLDFHGTAFQQRVWQALTRIPVGTTASYADIARRIGAPRSVRAVAQACGANAIAVAVPCHRVIRSDGALSGYRWGVERKQALLAREGVRG